MTEKAIEIIQATRDGEDLAPEDLKLVELAVNDWLNDAGKQKFEALYTAVVSGKYSKPWLNGVEHLTLDHSGYVYWKGAHVEHFNSGFAWSEDGKRHCLEISRRCRFLESIEIQPSAANVIWRWDEDHKAAAEGFE